MIITHEEFKVNFAPKLTEEFVYNLRLGVPPKLVNCALENYTGEKPIETPGFIQGPVGTGKSHLAVGYLRQEIENICANPEIRFIYPQNLSLEDPKLKRFRSVLDTVTFLPVHRYIRMMKEFDKAQETLKRLENLEFLVIDDLATERPTEFDISVIDELIISREEGAKKTLVTGNLKLDKVKEIYSDRIASRIASFGFIFKTEGEDMRIK